MKLLYLTDSKVPSQRASSIHVDQLMNAFTGLMEDVVLLSQKGDEDYEGDFNAIRVSIPNLKGGLIWLMWTFKKQIKRINPDFIYSRFLLMPLINKRIPYVLEVHDDAWNKGFLFRKAFQRAIGAKNCKGIVTITRAIKVDLKKAYPDLKKAVMVIEDAALPAHPEYEAHYDDKKTLTLGYVGSLHRGKGMEIIIPLAEKMPDCHFKIIGGTKEQIETHQAAVKGENVEFCGFVDHKEVWKHMIEVDICLLPNSPKVQTGKKSDIGRYTSPLKMFEYMAYAKPVIASDLEVLREVLDEEIAVLASHDQIQEWIDSVGFLKDAEIRKRIGENSLKRFKDNFTWKRRAERILSFVNEELERI